MFVTVESIFIGGRYLKYSRTLSQTPWFLPGEGRRGTGSVEECISEPMQAATRCDSTVFRSSGREDIDTRMLGSGRPFAVEIVNPRKCRFSDADLRELEAAISSDARVAVRDLVVLDKAELELLKEGEASKRKVRGIIVVSLSVRLWYGVLDWRDGCTMFYTCIPLWPINILSAAWVKGEVSCYPSVMLLR